MLSVQGTTPPFAQTEQIHLSTLYSMDISMIFGSFVEQPVYFQNYCHRT